MKVLWISNYELAELLVEKEVNIAVTKNMEMVVSDKDAERIVEIVRECAPAADGDYFLEDADEEFIVKSRFR